MPREVSAPTTRAPTSANLIELSDSDEHRKLHGDVYLLVERAWTDSDNALSSGATTLASTATTLPLAATTEAADISSDVEIIARPPLKPLMFRTDHNRSLPKPNNSLNTSKHGLGGGTFRPPKVIQLDELPDLEHTRSVPLSYPSNPSKLPVGAVFDLPRPANFGSSSDFMTQEQSEKALRELVTSMVDMEDVEECDMPEELSCKLLPHQVQGIQWMRSREQGKQSNKGGILADDMGLGKTVQTIGLILANKAEDKPRGTLIIVPLALKEQWASEICAKVEEDALRMLVHHGGKRTKDPKRLERFDVVITTYDVVASEWVAPPTEKKTKKTVANAESADESDDNLAIKKTKKPKELGPLFQAQFHRIVLDEAHTIKNHKTTKARACCELKAKYRWALTGTPIQNSIEDLYSLFKFLGNAAHPMDDWGVFRAKILDPIKRGRGKGAMERLQVILKALLLRRTKEQRVDGKLILELPARQIELVSMPFQDEDEEAFYKAINEKVQLEFNKFLNRGEIMSAYMQVLTLLLRLRQACSHPSLTRSRMDADSLERGTVANASEETELDDLADAFGALGVSKEEEAVPAPKTSVQSALTPSTKINKILELLEDIREENATRKTIVFTQFVAFIDLLEPFLKKKGFKFVKYHGSMRIEQREEALHKIKNRASYTVILVSLKCGSLGLNLTACSRVILADLWWNPAIENQAFDRAHRFGQREAVKIYKLAIKDTVEDKLLALQEKKQQLAKSALGEDGAMKKLNKLSAGDIMTLFS